MIFNFAFNTTATVQSFFNSAGNPITVQPYQAVDTTLIHGDTSGVLQPIGSFLNILDKKKVKRFYIHRTFALGDILMLVPVVRALRRKGYDPYLRTTRWAMPVLRLLDIEAEAIENNKHPAEGEYGIMLDGTTEQDHSRPKLQGLHRIDIYFKALGIQKMPRNLDWSLDAKRLPRFEPSVGDYVAFQGRGSTYKKALSVGCIYHIKKEFTKRGISVILIGEKSYGILEFFAVIAKAKALITMDSSPLWISHFTKTPTVGLFGPTRANERITKHPLYPKKVKGIALNKEMGCESCFEAAKKCNDSMACLKVINPDKIFRLIYSEVEGWL